jgi:hypothetical protein
MKKKNKYVAGLAFAAALFVASPLDDVIVASLFGTAFFGIGTPTFYVFVVVMTVVSLLFWKKCPFKQASLEASEAQ